MNRDKRVEKAQLKVLFTVPFFAPGVARLPVVWDSSVETACTDGKRIRWNPEWFDRCKDAELVTVLCEEVGHCLLGHLWRAPGGAHWPTWNGACDHAVRLMMLEFGEQLESKRLANPFPFPDPEGSLPDKKFSGMSEEQIYNLLVQHGYGQGKPAKGGGGSGQGNGGPAQGQGQQGHKLFAEFERSNLQQADQKKHKNDWESALVQSVQLAKGRGTLPGSLQRYVNELVAPRVPWWEVLRNWIREQCEDDYDWMRPNPYFDESGFMLPSLHSERIGPIVFATDTSGSITPELLNQFHAEKQSCLDDVRPSKVVDMCCDTRITHEKEYRPGDQIDREAPGGGGTSFVPIFKRIKELGDTPKCVVYLTDLDGQFPDEHPEYPVLWLAYGGNTKAPFGDVIEAI